MHTYVFKFSLNNYLVYSTYKYLIIEWFYSEILNHSPFSRSVFSYYISKIHCCRCCVVYFILIFISNIWFFALTITLAPSLPDFPIFMVETLSHLFCLLRVTMCQNSLLFSHKKSYFISEKKLSSWYAINAVSIVKILIRAKLWFRY